MAKNAPGKHYRRGISLPQLADMFPDNETAERWFVETRWPNGVVCPGCGSINILEVKTRKPQPFRCRDCRKCFSVKTGSVMHGSNLGYRTWAMAIYLLTTGIKGTASMKLARDLGLPQKTAWFLAHRIRETWGNTQPSFSGPVEADETYVGGLEKNKHRSKRLNAGRGTVGKIAVAGVKDRESNQVSAAVVDSTDGATLKGFVNERIQPDAMVYTDEALAYKGLPHHHAIKHSVGEYVDGQAHVNGLESFWSMMKRGYHGTYHKMSPKHLDRYVNEFAGRHNDRPLDTIDQMTAIVRGLDHKRVRYADLTAN